MTLSTIHPEILDTDILEETPMTDDEQRELIEVETSIKVNLSDRVERDLAIGKGLLTIFRKKLYRSPGGGRTWPEYLKRESAKLTPDGQNIDEKTAEYLRGFYRFRCEVLQPPSGRSENLPLPTSAYQVRPLISQLGTHPKAAIAIWKAACSQAGAGKVPNFDQVSRARSSFLSNRENEARRLSARQQRQLEGATAAAKAQRTGSTPNPQPTPRVPDPAPEPAIPAWQLEKDPDAIDAGVECRKVWTAINEASKALSHLRGILYSQTAKHGSAYLDGLRQIDAGVYSLNNIDDQIDGLKEDTDFIVSILSWEGEPGELNRSTVEAEAFPTR